MMLVQFGRKEEKSGSLFGFGRRTIRKALSETAEQHGPSRLRSLPGLLLPAEEKWLAAAVRDGFDQAHARHIGKRLGVDWGKVPLREFAAGLNIEREHPDVTAGDPYEIARIALAHLKEKPNYYSRLKKVEKAVKSTPEFANDKERKLFAGLVEQYGHEKALRVYYAMKTQAAKGEEHGANFAAESKAKRAGELAKAQPTQTKGILFGFSKAQPMNVLPGRQHLVLRQTHDTKSGKPVLRWMRPAGPMGGVSHTGHWLTVRGHRVFMSSQQPRVIAAVESEAKSGHLVGKELSADDHRRFLENTGQRERRAPRTKDEKLSGDRKKFARVREFNDKLPALQRALNAGLRAKDMAAVRVKAAVVTLMLKAHLRIGNEESADWGVAGATTLMPENITVTGNTVRLTFTGKSGVQWNSKVTDKALAASVAEALRNAEPGKPLFRKRGPEGELLPLTDREIRQDLAQQGVLPKDLRTWAASVIAFREFKAQSAKRGETLTKREIARRANVVFEKVAAELGHSPAMAKNNYVSPALTRWFESHGGRMTLSKARFAA